MQQHLLYDGVAESGTLPVPILAQDVPGHLQFGVTESRTTTAHRLWRQTQTYHRTVVLGELLLHN